MRSDTRPASKGRAHVSASLSLDSPTEATRTMGDTPSPGDPLPPASRPQVIGRGAGVRCSPAARGRPSSIGSDRIARAPTVPIVSTEPMDPRHAIRNRAVDHQIRTEQPAHRAPAERPQLRRSPLVTIRLTHRYCPSIRLGLARGGHTRPAGSMRASTSRATKPGRRLGSSCRAKREREPERSGGSQRCDLRRT